MNMESSASSQHGPDHNLWLIQTKLLPPVPHKNIIEREKLIGALTAFCTSHPLTLISAPAGYGKTTLISSLVHSQKDLKYAWLSLDMDDNDPARFLADLIAAIEKAAPDFATSTRNLLSGLDNPAAELRRLLGVLTNDIRNIKHEPVIIIFDDYHTIQEESIHRAVDFFIDHLPNNTHLVISTRKDPPLSLSLLRSRGHLAEFRLDNLKFSNREIDDFLNNKNKLRLSRESLFILENNSEGWPAVLRLLAISLDGFAAAPDRAAFIARLPQSQYNVFSFLAEEILNQQDSSVREFLLKTSILSELNSELCRAVTGQENSAAILESLSRANLVQLIAGVPEKDQSQKYRYHDLFADFLAQQLANDYPGEHIRNLHYLAAESQPGEGQAVTHYLEAERWDEAAFAIQEIGDSFIFLGLYDSLINWISALPERTIDRFPKLSYLLGVCAFQHGEFEKAQKLIEQAYADFELSGDEALVGETKLLLGAIASGFHDVENAGILLDEALNYELSPQMKIMAHINRAWTGVYSNNWALAEQDVSSAMQIAFQSEELSAFNSLAPHLTAVFLFIPNGVSIFKEYCNQVLAAYGDQVSPTQVSANVLSSTFHMMEGDLEESRKLLEIARRDCDLLGGFVWLDISLDFSSLRIDLIQSKYSKLEEYWQKRLVVYENLPGAREYLSSYLYILGYAYWSQNRIEEAMSIYERMQKLESPQDLPENQLTRSLMGVMLMISEGRYVEAEGILRQVEEISRYAPHSVLFGNPRAMMVDLYMRQERIDQAMALLDKMINDFQRRNMLGLLLIDRPHIASALETALGKKINHTNVKWLLDILDKSHGYQPIYVQTTGEKLTQREVEVLHLIIEGMTNLDIAEKLVISETTVKSHISSIFRKLNVTSRTQAIAQARALNLF